MRKMRNWMALASIIALTAGVSVATASPAAAYTPGTVKAFKPTYNVNDGGYNYHCSFAGWRYGAKVTWHCDLHQRSMDEATGQLIDEPVPSERHSGSWTPSPSGHTTATWLHKLQIPQPQLCVVAFALSVDGGVSVEKCQG
jgi:hypothetical protein